ncbi:MAG TPA: SBBP repeat-containing protein [Bryobacteraceae bacterium]|nr:SBBP repeat-containing protein [Bryobacteraceae bacterium]
MQNAKMVIAPISLLLLSFQLHAQLQRRTEAPNTSQLPLSFEPNVGQTDSTVKYLVHGRGQMLFLTSDHAVLRLTSVDSTVLRPRSIRDMAARKVRSAAVRMGFRNSSKTAAIEALDPLPGRVNYFIGKDPTNWHTDIQTYGRIAYRGVYPGIDLVYYGQQGSMEYDFVAQPGADPRLIQVEFEGANRMQLTPEGDLLLDTAAGPVRWKKPAVYQNDHGVRKPIAADYRLKGSRVGFQLAKYDRKLPLVIDPTLVYSTFLGGSGDDEDQAALVDPTGVYTAGTTSSADFPTTPGAFSTTLGGGGSATDNCFVAKFNPQMSALIYSTYIGGENTDAENQLWLAPDGTVYLTGFTTSFGFPTTPGAFSRQYGNGQEEAFVTHLSAAGNSLLFSTYLGGTFDDDGYGLWVDLNGNVYVTGETGSFDFPVTPQAFQQNYGGGVNDAFVTKLDPTGSTLIYSTYLGGGGAEAVLNPSTGPAPPQIRIFFGTSIAVDLAGNAYVSGVTTSANFPTTPGAYSRTNKGGSGDGFLTKLNPTGSALVASTLLGSTGFDAITSHQVDPSGNVLVGGVTGSTSFPTTAGAYSRTYHGGATDMFICRFDPTLSTLTYSTLFGGSDQEATVYLIEAGNGTVLASGLTYSSDVPTTPGTFQARYAGNGDMFLSFFDSNITTLLDSTYLGGVNLDTGSAYFTSQSPTDVFATGRTESHAFPTTPNAFLRTFTDTGGVAPIDGFISRFQFTGGCNETISPTTLQVGVAGGPQSVTISAPSGCVWFGYPNAPWLTITNPSGTGNSTMNFTVGPNNTGAARTGTLSVAGSPLTIQQSNVASQCTFTINPTSAPYTAAGGNGSVSITASAPSCAWTATSNVSWISITSAAGGTGSGTINYNVQATGAARTGTMTVAGQTFTVNESGSGQTAGLVFVPVTPCRVLDTRGATGMFGGPFIGAGSTRTVPIPQSTCNTPATAQAYSLNATVVPVATLGYLSIWPAGQSQPIVSTLNSTDGRIVANAAIVPAGINGAINLFASDATQVILDINGYFAPAATLNGLSFYSVTPCRVADTRTATGPFGGPSMVGGSSRNFAVPMSPCSVPNTAQAYSLNFTVVPRARQLGYLTTWPAGQTQPIVSTLNSTDGGIVANAAIVPAGSGGAISVFVTDNADVIIDINGYFGPPGSPGAQALYPVTPCRIVDTRGGGVFTGSFGPPLLAGNTQRSFQVPGGPCSGIPTTSQAYSLNVTVVPNGVLGYLSAWPTGQPQPVVSTLNSLLGKIVANAAIVPAGQNGAISVYVTDPTQLILDINAYFAP